MRICIFGASSEDISQIYKDTAFELGQQLAESGHTLVFGGGRRGLMGAVARGFRDRGGYVIGIAPRLFDTGTILLEESDELIITQDMSERKQKMIEMSDAFIALAGGIGTYDELFQVLVESQLDYHHKPVIVYNVNGFYDKLLEMLDHTVAEGFMHPGQGRLYEVCASPAEVIECLKEKA